MRNSRLFLIVVLFAMLLVSQAQADAPKWEIDPAHSGVYFDVTHIFSTVRGHFDDYGGDIFFDPDDPAASRCDIQVEVKSIDTRNRQRDNHLRSDDFFAAGKYPVMRFVSTRVEKVGNGQYIVEGKLTVKDVTKDIRVPFTFLGTAENPFDAKQIVAGLETRFNFDRLEYNVGTGKYYKMGVTGKDIVITISMEVIRAK